MSDEEKYWGWPPSNEPSLYVQKGDHWRHFDNSVDAVSFGFVATAILISMFLVMAIFERFLRPPSPESTPSGGRRNGDVESMVGFNVKLAYPSPKVRLEGFRIFFHDFPKTVEIEAEIVGIVCSGGVQRPHVRRLIRHQHRKIEIDMKKKLIK